MYICYCLSPTVCMSSTWAPTPCSSAVNSVAQLVHIIVSLVFSIISKTFVPSCPKERVRAGHSGGHSAVTLTLSLINPFYHGNHVLNRTSRKSVYMVVARNVHGRVQGEGRRSFLPPRVPACPPARRKRDRGSIRSQLDGVCLIF